MRTIGILGCGWLGLPLAKSLISEGHKVSGTVSRQEGLTELHSAGIHAYQIALIPTEIKGPIDLFLNDLQSLVIAIPPGLRKHPPGSYCAKMELLIPLLKSAPIKQLIFVSSTSVYGNPPYPIDETFIPKPIKASAMELLAVEELIRKKIPQTVVVRMGGLIGENRQPIRQLSGRENVSGRLWPVNLIHQSDAVALLAHLIQHDSHGIIINGVHPSHPTKADYYQEQGRLLNLPPPLFNPLDNSLGKTVLSSVNTLGFEYQHPI